MGRHALILGLAVLGILSKPAAAADLYSFDRARLSAAVAIPHGEPVLADWDYIERYRIDFEADFTFWRFHLEEKVTWHLGNPWQQPCHTLPPELRDKPTWNGAMCMESGWRKWGSTDWSVDGSRRQFQTVLAFDVYGPVQLFWENVKWQDSRGSNYWNMIGLRLTFYDIRLRRDSDE